MAACETPGTRTCAELTVANSGFLRKDFAVLLVAGFALTSCSRDAASVEDCIERWNDSPPQEEILDLHVPDGVKLVVSIEPDGYGGNRCLFDSVGFEPDGWTVFETVERDWNISGGGMQTPSGDPANAVVTDADDGDVFGHFRAVERDKTGQNRPPRKAETENKNKDRAGEAGPNAAGPISPHGGRARDGKRQSRLVSGRFACFCAVS